jgi:hypothetical protein
LSVQWAPFPSTWTTLTGEAVGNERDRRRRLSDQILPSTGWAWLATLEAGGWAPWEPELVDIPATFALEGGVWYAVRQGVRGLLAQDEKGEPVAYVLCEPATRYYHVMTRSERMPVLIAERI